MIRRFVKVSITPSGVIEQLSENSAGQLVIGVPVTGLTIDSLQGNPVSGATPSMGDTLTWDGSAWTPTAPAASSTSYTIIEGFNTEGTNYFETATDILNVEQFVLHVICRFRYWDNAESTRYQVFGTRNQFGDNGHSIEIVTPAPGGQATLRATATTISGTVVTLDEALDRTLIPNRWTSIIVQKQSVGTDHVVTSYVNGGYVDQTTTASETGAYASNPLAIGGPSGGGSGTIDGAEPMSFLAAAVVTSSMTSQQIGNWVAACIDAGDMVDIPSGSVIAHRWKASSWAGSGNLTDDVGSVDMVLNGTLTTSSISVLPF